MPPDVVRRLIPLHGIVSWVDALLLVAVTIILVRQQRPDKPFFRWLAISASLGAGLSFVSGLGLELHYRMHLRQRLFVASKTLGWFFERTFHLSFGVVAFAMVGLLLLILARHEARFFRPMRAAYLLAAAFALTICVISLVARIAGPQPH